MSEEKKKNLNAEADSILKELYDDELKNTNAGLNAMDRVRLIADGALMGWSDEISAYAQSFYKDKTYDEIVREERSAWRSIFTICFSISFYCRRFCSFKFCKISRYRWGSGISYCCRQSRRSH